MAPELIWLAGGIAGYIAAMACNPVRGFFADGFNLLRERGRLLLWLPVAALSLLPLSFGWRGDGAPDGAQDGAPPDGALVAGLADGAGVFTSIVRYRVDPAARALPVKTRVALTLGALLWAVLAVGFQFCILVALYLGAVMPERDPGWLGLLDFAWRRTLRYWPGVLCVAALTAFPLWLPAGGIAHIVLWVVAALAAAVFAFVQVALLSGERELRAAVAANFACWCKLPYLAVWFLAVVALHLFLLHVSAAATARLLAGNAFLSGLWRALVELIRAGMLTWLLAAWVLLYCTKTKNPSRRRIRP